MAQVNPVTSHNTEDGDDWADDGIYEGASAETMAAREAEFADPADDDEPVQVAPIRYEPVFAWPVHGVFVMEISYADFGDLGASQGGTVALGKVMGSEEHPKLIPLRGCFVLFRADAGERWLLRGHWYRFISGDDVVAIISSVESDPRIANLQALQQAESAREVLFNTSRTPDRLVPERDWTKFP